MKNKDDMRHQPPERVMRHKHLYTLLILVVVGLCYAAAYGLTSLLYRLTGRPPEIWTQIITGMVGLLLIFTVVGISQHLFRRTKWGERHDHMGQLSEALRQISQGNFDVFLEPDKSGMNYELADTINDMARNLGTMEAMRQEFISNVSHEIQSPLTSIGGFAALIQNDDLPIEKRRRYASIIEAESKRLSSLSENLLKLSSLDNSNLEIEKKEFRLDKQLEAVALTLEPQWSEKQLLLEADLEKCTISGNEDLLSQVWINLLNNAVKFTPEGGQIAIGLTIKNDGVFVTIDDTGVGIAPEEQVHIFERFYKVDKARDRSLGGNGLGLSLVKRIVGLHGGDVTVESESGKGTVFTVELPIR